MLRLIKIIHTIIWIVMVAATIYILIAAIMGIYGIWLWLALGLMAIEVIVLLLGRMECPFTTLAKKFGGDFYAGKDIYLPKWLAALNKSIFGAILFAGVGILIIRLIF
jgi:hypothetical protein